MRSRTTSKFRQHHKKLPTEIKAIARQRYMLFAANPNHPSLQFKSIRRLPNAYSVRINKDYRAIGTLRGGEITWLWIGAHDDYIAIIDNRRIKDI